MRECWGTCLLPMRTRTSALPGHVAEGGEELFDVGVGVGGHEAEAQAGGIGGGGRGADGGNVEAFLLEERGGVEGFFGIAEDDGDDGCRRLAAVEAEGGQFSSDVVGQVKHALATRGVAFDDA